MPVVLGPGNDWFSAALAAGQPRSRSAAWSTPCVGGNACLRAAIGVAQPGLGQTQMPVDQRVAGWGDVGPRSGIAPRVVDVLGLVRADRDSTSCRRCPRPRTCRGDWRGCGRRGDSLRGLPPSRWVRNCRALAGPDRALCVVEATPGSAARWMFTSGSMVRTCRPVDRRCGTTRLARRSGLVLPRWAWRGRPAPSRR